MKNITFEQLKKLIRESVADEAAGGGEMTVGEFLRNVREIYARYFPNSYCKALLYKFLGKAITIDCYLAKDKGECSNGYWENDMFKVSFWIHDMPESSAEDSPMPEIIRLTSDSHSFIIEPKNEHIHYCNYRRVPYRETAGSPEKCLQAFERFVKKLYNAVEEAQADGEIHKNYIELLKDKI